MVMYGVYQQRDISQVDESTDQLSYPAIHLPPFQTRNKFRLKSGNVGSAVWQAGSYAGLKEVWPFLLGKETEKRKCRRIAKDQRGGAHFCTKWQIETWWNLTFSGSLNCH